MAYQLHNTNKLIPSWVVPVLAILFAILWGIWLLPHTVFIRHVAMVMRSLAGLCARALN